MIHQQCWRKSSHSDATGQCVEVAAAPDQVLVRDSKNPDGPRVAVPAAEWMKLLTRLKAR